MPDYRSLYEQNRLVLLDSLIPHGRGLAVDVGCNEGNFTGLLVRHGYQAVGLDLDAEAVARGTRANPGLDLRVGGCQDTEGLGPRGLTLCLEVLEHLDACGQESMLASLARATPPGGLLLISTPGRHSLVSLYERARLLARGERHYDWWDPSHIRVLSWRRLRRLLKRHGFTVLRLTGFHYLPLRLRPPTATENRWLAPMGFDLIVVAQRDEAG